MIQFPGQISNETAPRIGQPNIPIAAAFSFLKDTRGLVTWNLRDLTKTLKITAADARQVLAIFEMQGYVRAAGEENEWMTTMAGENASGSAAPHFVLESVEKALSSLKDRIKSANKGPKAAFTVTKAVAFGDFLNERPQVQAADIGIDLKRRTDESSEQTFLRILRNKSQFLHLSFFEAWMSIRTHRKLI